MRHLLRALIVFTAATFSSTQALAQEGRWLRAETPGFIVYGAMSEQEVRGLAQELETFDGLLRRMTEAPAERSPTKLEVYLLSSDQFAEVFPDRRDSIVGLYSARVDQIAAFTIHRRGGGIDGKDILLHEYAHHFMFQYFANAYPAWYVEGFAEFVSTAVLGTQRIVLGRSNEGRFYSLRNQQWMPIERLITVSPHELDSREAALFYAQSWLFTHYLVLTPGKMDQFRAYVRALRLGQDSVTAFEAGFGMTPQDMLAELRRYYRGSPNALALTRPEYVALPDIRVTRLPASADRLLPSYARIRHGVREADQAAALARVRELAAGGSDRFSMLTLALAEVRLGERERARALLTPHLDSNPEDVEALYIMGASYLEDADATSGGDRDALQAQARRYFARAYRSDANHVPSLYRYAQSYRGVMMDGPTWQNYLNVLLLSHQLAPQIDEISINTASVLMSHNRHAEAIPMLRAVAYDPHGGGNVGVARQMLEQAEAALGAAE